MSTSANTVTAVHFSLKVKITKEIGILNHSELSMKTNVQQISVNIVSDCPDLQQLL